jgi:hypothetical protein
MDLVLVAFLAILFVSVVFPVINLVLFRFYIKLDPFTRATAWTAQRLRNEIAQLQRQIEILEQVGWEEEAAKFRRRLQQRLDWQTNLRQYPFYQPEEEERVGHDEGGG